SPNNMVRLNINSETGNDNYAFQVITDLKLRARRQPSGATVLILAAIDSDGVCGAAILSSLLTREGVKFAVEPISHMLEARAAVFDIARARVGQAEATRHRDVRSIVMIGCGCLEDLDGILEESGLPGSGCNADDLVIYVFDSHRPIHLSNIYEKQNRVIVIDDDQEG
ncbi:DNA replication initiation factor cdc45, partial [Perkinsus olseni]